MTKAIIFAVGLDNSFGNKGGLPWPNHDKDDMMNFRTVTKDFKNIVMASKTFESLERLLPERKHFVVSSKIQDSKNVTYINPKSYNFEVIDKNLAKQGVESYIVIGGKSLIESALKSSIDFTVYLTIMDSINEADVHIDLSIMSRNGYKVKSKEAFDKCTIFKIERG